MDKEALEVGAKRLLIKNEVAAIPPIELLRNNFKKKIVLIKYCLSGRF